MLYLRNFLTLLRRYKVSSVLNILGMAVGFAAIYLLLVQVVYDLSYNRGIPDGDRIYRLEYPSWANDGMWYANWERQLPVELCAGIPEIEAAGAIAPCWGWVPTKEFSISRNATIDNFRLEISYAEREGIGVFPFEIVAGNLDDYRGEGTMILTASAAARHGLSVGDVLHFGRGALPQSGNCTLVAICRDFPAPSSLAIGDGWIGMKPRDEADESQWNFNFYLRLQPGASPETVTRKMAEAVETELRDEGAGDETIAESLRRFAPRLTPISRLYFIEDAAPEGMSNSRMTTLALGAIAVAILVVTFINFVNFFFALIPVRIRVVNTFKIFGAPTSRLRLNFLFETVGLVCIALFFAMEIVLFVSNSSLAELFATKVWVGDQVTVAVGTALAMVLIGVAVSLYPAWYITRFPPAMVIKGNFAATRSGRLLRLALVAVQYTISITLIVCALFILRQHRYMLHKELGFDRSQLLTVTLPMELFSDGLPHDFAAEGVSNERRDAFTDCLKRNPQIVDVAYAQGELVAPSRMGWAFGENQRIAVQVYPVSANFLQMMGIPIEQGRDFLASDEQAPHGSMIFNCKAAQQFELEPGSLIPVQVGSEQDTPVVGICSDFNFRPLQYGIDPFAFLVYGRFAWEQLRHAYIRTAPDADQAAVRRYIRNAVADFAPDADPAGYEVRLFDDELEAKYQREERLSTLVGSFALLSVFISMVGVFGLVFFETQYRRREIGIRRVIGASTEGILAMFNRSYLGIIAACSAVALPTGYLIVTHWMEQFAYRSPMVWWVYVVAVGLVALITVVTVTLRSWHAANENPIDAIQH